MKFMFKLFSSLYTIAPLLIIPYWAYSNNNWFLLIGIPFSYFGSYSPFSRRLKLFIPWFLLLCIGVWIKIGFDIHQYITFFFFCSLWGYMMTKIAEGYDQQNKRGTLENDEELNKLLKEKPEYLQGKMKIWNEENPDKKMTFEIMDALARGRQIKESDLSGTPLSELVDGAVKSFYLKNPKVLEDKITKWKEQNPGQEVTTEIIDWLAKNKKGVLLD